MSNKHKRKTNRPVGVSKKTLRKQQTKDRVAKKKESDAQKQNLELERTRKSK